MAIDTTYRKLILDAYIKTQLTRGVTLSAQDIADTVTSLLTTLDLTVPQFTASNFYVVSKDSSSASQFVSAIDTIRQDLRALYKELIELTKTSLIAAERWNAESAVLEKKLIDLEERIDDLLLLIQDVNPQQGIIVENFTDMHLVDKDLTSAFVDLQSTTAYLGKTNTSVTRVFLNELIPGDDVTFKIRSTIDVVGRQDATNATIADPFSQESRTWWTSVNTKSVRPMTCELIVKLGETAVPISKIFIELHDSIEASALVVTPLYSTDNINFAQLPTNTFTQEVRNIATFQFSEVNAKWVKFILIKRGPDLSSSDATLFSYQFGFKEISFYAEAFDDNTTQQLISNPLSIIDIDGSPLEYEKVILETCERIEANTSIRYYITTSNDSDVVVNSSTIWTPIAPTNRLTSPYSKILTVGDIEDGIIGDNEFVTITSGVNEGFWLISEDGAGDIQTTLHASSSNRYTYKNSNDRLLNHQIKDQEYTGSGGTAIQINERTLTIFRNVGEQGLNPTSDTIRNIQRGWRFEDPYYICVVEIDNPEGISIDVGDFPMIVDNTSYTNKIDNTVLTGKAGDNTGIHKIKVHKSRWKYVTPNLNTLAELKSADPLYPYNHKLLVEGYVYGSSYPITSEKKYHGVDLFAETLMKKVSPFDIYNNVKEDNYDVYALDKDAPGTHTDGNSKPTKVILLKIDEDDANFQNETFMIKFTRINQLKKYLRLRADFATTDTKVTPALHAYKIKLG